MKKKSWIFPGALLLLLIPATSAAQTASVDSLVHKLFLSLKNKDEKSYIDLFPSYTLTKNMFRKSVEKMKGNIAIPDAKINMDSLMDAELDKFTEDTYKADIQGNLRKSFQSIIKEGEYKGIKWSRSQLASYTLDTINEPDIDVTSVKGMLNLTDSANEYELYFTDILFFEEDKKWYGASLNKLVRKGDGAENDVRDDEIVVDTTVNDKAPKKPGVPPAPAKKASSKKPVSEKPATPANKPKR